MELDALLLSRIQFGFTISFHILFPAFTIGLASWLAFLEGMWLATGRGAYRRLYAFWVRIFAVSFGMGVVSGITMSYQFGTNWSRFSDVAGNIIGPLLSYEVLTAFFLEATFLGVMLFGWKLVGNRLHFVATLAVAVGTLISTFWIIAANSWMQTPAGYELRDGIFHPADWWQIVFNPSFPYRLAHMVLAAYLTTCFVVGGVGAWHLLRGRAVEQARLMLGLAVGFAALVVPLQILAGDLHGLNVREHQPAKLAAIEGHWETGSGIPLILFAWPDMAAEENRWELSVPHLGSLILTHEWNGEVLGLKEWPAEDRPNVPVVFWSFRIMVGLGLLMLAASWTGLFLLWRRRLFAQRLFQRAMVAMSPSGFVAVLAGWYTVEIGRQPWIVYGLMRTADAASPAVAAESVALTLALFIAGYLVIFGAGIFYILRLIARGPEDETPPAAGETERPARPISAAEAPEAAS